MEKILTPLFKNTPLALVVIGLFFDWRSGWSREARSRHRQSGLAYRDRRNGNCRLVIRGSAVLARKQRGSGRPRCSRVRSKDYINKNGGYPGEFGGELSQETSGRHGRYHRKEQQNRRSLSTTSPQFRSEVAEMVRTIWNWIRRADLDYCGYGQIRQITEDLLRSGWYSLKTVAGD